MSAHYRAAEKLMYSYPVNLMRWREAIKQYMRICGETDCHGQSYSVIRQETGVHSDPPNEYVARKEKALYEVQKYSRKTYAVREVLRELRQGTGDYDSELLLVMDLYYFEGITMRELSEQLCMNERTLYRRREMLVRKVMSVEQRKRESESCEVS